MCCNIIQFSTVKSNFINKTKGIKSLNSCITRKTKIRKNNNTKTTITIKQYSKK